MTDNLTNTLYNEICKIPLIDPHSHINPFAPTAKNLDEILGYHYYTELAHSAGMSKDPLGSNVEPRERVQALLANLDKIDNTVQYSWFVEIAQTFLDFPNDRAGFDDADFLWSTADRRFGQDEWEKQVFQKSNLEKIFLTNEFDDELDGFDSTVYIPCLRTDTLVFGLHKPEVQQRLAKVTGIEVKDQSSIQRAFKKLFEHFLHYGAKACAISLPPSFSPRQEPLSSLDQIDPNNAASLESCARSVFWQIAECCREYQLPFDLMIGVNRSVYKEGVFQGQDLFDQRTSLIQYADLFNAFPEVTFPISVLSSGQNQELVSYSWIFPNVVTNGHWWYSNIPAYIEQDCRARLQAVPKTKQVGYYSDAYKLEFVLPKYNMYRRVLAYILAEDFVETGAATEEQALALAHHLLRDNVQRIFMV